MDSYSPKKQEIPEQNFTSLIQEPVLGKGLAAALDFAKSKGILLFLIIFFVKINLFLLIKYEKNSFSNINE